MLSDEELRSHIGEGWFSFTKPVLDALEEHGFKLAQIKEKFGYLRIYVDAPEGASPTLKGAMHAMIAAAESISTRTCEECGAPGQHRLVRNSWWKTRCEECKDK